MQTFNFRKTRPFVRLVLKRLVELYFVTNLIANEGHMPTVLFVNP